MKRVLVLMITSALLAGMVGCSADPEPTPSVEYSLTISSSDGGEVTTPGEGSFTYEERTAVNLVAVAEEGYQFVDWTGDVDTGEHVSAASVTIIMNRDRSVAANFAKTDSDPVTIWDWYDLDSIRDNLTGSYLLMNDLDSTTVGYMQVASATANDGRGWQPIGSIVIVHSYFQGAGDSFSGTLDGQGYEIRNLFVNHPHEHSVGLFSCIGETGVVKNVGVADAEVIGFRYIGGLAGVNCGGIVMNSYFCGNVAGASSIGGLVGENHGTVSNSYSTGSSSGMYWIGGLVGKNHGTVGNSYSVGSAAGVSTIGGLVGENQGTVEDCYSCRSVTGLPPVGGLVGINSGAASSCFWDIDTSGTEWSAGGIGKTAARMQDVTTFLDVGWNIVAVAIGETDRSRTWNIVDGQTYPFLSRQSRS